MNLSNRADRRSDGNYRTKGAFYLNENIAKLIPHKKIQFRIKTLIFISPMDSLNSLLLHQDLNITPISSP